MGSSHDLLVSSYVLHHRTLVWNSQQLSPIVRASVVLVERSTTIVEESSVEIQQACIYSVILSAGSMGTVVMI